VGRQWAMGQRHRHRLQQLLQQQFQRQDQHQRRRLEERRSNKIKFDKNQFNKIDNTKIKIPTPRWTAYDAKYYGLKMGPEVTVKTQERAYTSPIWYTPTL
jgi:Protein of unknown function (DUF3604)